MFDADRVHDDMSFLRFNVSSLTSLSNDDESVFDCFRQREHVKNDFFCCLLIDFTKKREKHIFCIYFERRVS